MKTVLVAWLVAFSVNAFASVYAEIDHLLHYVASTDCQYERNGSLHNGAEAVKHIQRKYDYYRDDIQSAEDFIAYSASKSALSGRYYWIHCDGQAPQKSQDWLSAELVRFRMAS